MPTAAPTDSAPLSPARLAAAALAGPLALGAVLAARTTSLSPLAALPLVILAVTAVTAPALYIATAAAGAAPPARVMMAAVGRALGAMGIGLLGFVAPVAFLAATTMEPGTGVALISIAVIGGSLIGLLSLHRSLFAGGVGSPLQRALFVGWALVALTIAARLYVDFAVGGAS